MDGERRSFALERIHMEEDAGKLTHEGTRSLVDWNRGGTPLIEIVGKPDIHSAEAAAEWFKMMQRVMTAAGVTIGDLQKGHFRCDANVSLAKRGPAGTRVELKNINSFRFLAKAIRHEIQRQTALLQAGERVVQSTRTWTGTETVALRTRRCGGLSILSRSGPRASAGHAVRFIRCAGSLGIHPVGRVVVGSKADALNALRTEYGLSHADASALCAAPELDLVSRYRFPRFGCTGGSEMDSWARCSMEE